VQVHQVGSIKYYQFSSFIDLGVYHAIFTRHGGVSPSPWKSLNFGASVGDDRNRVLFNKQSALKTIMIKTESVYDVHQVHSNEVIYTEKALQSTDPHIKADAIITNTPGITLMMRFADCVPIMLFDPDHRAIGIAHAGWIGTVNKIAEKIVKRMKERFSSDPNSLLAAIGPSIGPDHYVVGEDVVEIVKSNFVDAADQLLIHNQGKTYFDLWSANELILINSGVCKIEVAEICTQCRLEDWFSHRGEHGRTGRFGVVMGLIP
jgi:hypothetical protein